MVVLGVVPIEGAVKSINLPTILLLYSLMIISAQLRLGGFYTWIALKIVPYYTRPRIFLLISMIVSAILSAILANDIVCFAFTPILALSLLEAGLNPLPYLIGLAVSSNIGSAATIIGNPQNMLIGQTGNLSFSGFLFWSAPPSILALLASYLIILWSYRNSMYYKKESVSQQKENRQPFDKWQTTKGILAILILVAMFFSSIPREFSAIGIAGVLLCSRKMKTRDIMGLVDWHLITLFCSLFVIIYGISQTGHLGNVINYLSNIGMNLHNLYTLTGISVLSSNLFSNVPATMLLIGFLDPSQHIQWYTLAVSSTFAGNLFLLGSIANLIVVEQAANYDIQISFSQHARVGIPVTMASLMILGFWL